MIPKIDLNVSEGKITHKYNVSGQPKDYRIKKKEYEPRKCEQCGHEFTPTKVYQKFCSEYCRYRHWKSKENEKKQLKRGLEIQEAEAKKGVCEKETCKLFTKEIKNHCSALSEVVLVRCPFYEKGERHAN